MNGIYLAQYYNLKIYKFYLIICTAELIHHSIEELSGGFEKLREFSEVVNALFDLLGGLFVSLSELFEVKFDQSQRDFSVF